MRLSCFIRGLRAARSQVCVVVETCRETQLASRAFGSGLLRNGVANRRQISRGHWRLLGVREVLVPSWAIMGALVVGVFLSQSIWALLEMLYLSGIGVVLSSYLGLSIQNPRLSMAMAGLALARSVSPRCRRLFWLDWSLVYRVFS